MFLRHPEKDLIPYLRGELDERRSQKIEAHLRQCSRCRASTETYRSLIEQLSESVSEPPAIDWSIYRAQVNQKLDQSLAHAPGAPARQSGGRAWYRRPLIFSAAALCASAIGIILALASRPTPVSAPGGQEVSAWQQAQSQEAMVASQMELFENYPVVERLELLENLDVIQHLDELSSRHRGAHGA